MKPTTVLALLLLLPLTATPAAVRWDNYGTATHSPVLDEKAVSYKTPEPKRKALIRYETVCYVHLNVGGCSLPGTLRGDGECLLFCRTLYGSPVAGEGPRGFAKCPEKWNNTEADSGVDPGWGRCGCCV